MLELGQLKAENIHLNDLIRTLRREKEGYVEQVLSLEAEITETIETYTKVIEDINAGNNESAVTKNKKNKKIKTILYLRSINSINPLFAFVKNQNQFVN